MSNEEKLTKVGINWDNPTYVKPLTNPYKLKVLQSFLFTFYQQKMMK